MSEQSSKNWLRSAAEKAASWADRYAAEIAGDLAAGGEARSFWQYDGSDKWLTDRLDATLEGNSLAESVTLIEALADYEDASGESWYADDSGELRDWRSVIRAVARDTYINAVENLAEEFLSFAATHARQVFGYDDEEALGGYDRDEAARKLKSLVSQWLAAKAGDGRKD